LTPARSNPLSGEATRRIGRDPETLRPGWIDLIVLAVLVTLIGFVVYRVELVLQYRWHWSALPRFILRWDPASRQWVPNILLLGLFTTIRLTIWSALMALAGGLVLAMGRIGRSLALRLTAQTYVEFVRNIPELVFIFIFYFFVASEVMPLLGIDTALNDASPRTLAMVDLLFGKPELFTSFLPAALAIGLFEAAAVSEIIRAGIQSVGKGQWDAGAALGLRPRPTLRLIVLPQAMSRILPPLAGQIIALVKDSALAATISVPELTFSGGEVAVSTRGMFEIWLVVAAVYFLICSSLSLVFSRLEARAKFAS
jgi:polar amino acid transport system permease protein